MGFISKVDSEQERGSAVLKFQRRAAWISKSSFQRLDDTAKTLKDVTSFLPSTPPSSPLTFEKVMDTRNCQQSVHNRGKDGPELKAILPS